MRSTVPTDFADLLKRAILLHQQGELQQARQLYRRILDGQPDNEEALLMSAIVETQERNYQQALILLDRIIAAGKANPDVYNNRCVVLTELSRYTEALESCAMALRLKPDFAEALYNRGNIEQKQERFEEALTSYDQALRLKPDFVAALFNRGKVSEALKRRGEALECFAAAILIDPGFAEAQCGHGKMLMELGRAAEALKSFDMAIRLKPDFAEAHFYRGNALHLLDRLEEAQSSFRTVINLNPDVAETWYNLGVTFHKMKRYEEALPCYDAAIDRNPDYTDAHANRGNVLYELKRFAEALESSDRALRLRPDIAEAFSNRGNALQELSRYDEALSSYTEAIRLEPDFAEAHWNRSLLNLLLGNFEEGWAEYEWRWENPFLSQQKANYAQPLYTGKEPLAGKRLLLHAEQGFGDIIQFCRYARLFSEPELKLVLGVTANLASLMRGLRPDIDIIVPNDPLPDFDYHCPFLSLPLAFRTTVESIPVDEKYLAADQEKVSQWRARLGPAVRPRIGLAWSGSNKHHKDRIRNIALCDLLASIPDNADCFVLQKEIRESDRVTLMQQEKVRDFSGDLHDFSDTAALIECLDLVVTVDTSAAHLAGALGKPTWLLLPFLPDWRWMLDREDSPWYPSMKLYRQSRNREWAEVLSRVSSDLGRLIDQQSLPS